MCMVVNLSLFKLNISVKLVIMQRSKFEKKSPQMLEIRNTDKMLEELGKLGNDYRKKDVSHMKYFSFKVNVTAQANPTYFLSLY